MQLGIAKLRTYRVLEVKEHFLYASQLHTTHSLYSLPNSLPGAVVPEMQFARQPGKPHLLAETRKHSVIDQRLRSHME